ncbi:Holliday junction branch migration DNA helicase RuvB [Corynebacterium frankenforstense]
MTRHGIERTEFRLPEVAGGPGGTGGPGGPGNGGPGAGGAGAPGAGGFGGPAGGTDDAERPVTPHKQAGEGDVERNLRPRSLNEFIGQQKVREQLSLVLTGAKNRGVTPDHILLSGPPGLGKTTMAMIIAQELGTSLRMTSGPALERAGDLAAMLSNLIEGDVLFIDEIHRMARPAEEMLYMAMEDFRIDVIVGKGPGATSIPLDLPPFTLVAATTRAGMLTGPLRDRFGFTAQMEFYDTPELTRVVTRAARILDVGIDDDAAAEIASRSRGTPRIANRLLRRVRDYAEVHADGRIDLASARGALAVFDVDEVGLDRLDRAVLDCLIKGHGGGPVGVGTLAVAVGEEPSTIEEVCEPYLVRAGLIARTGRGRVATAAAWRHLGLEPPEGAPGLY